MLRGKTGLVVGVANKRSLGWAVAEAWAAAGASVLLTYQNNRFQSNLQQLISNKNMRLYECDFASDDNIQQLIHNFTSDTTIGSIDMICHSIAYAEASALKQPFLNTSREAFRNAHEISAYSLVALTRCALPILSTKSSILALSYIGSTKVVPNYNVMGPAKASLEASVRQLAFELGPKEIRVNCISPGPVNTLAARGIPGILKMIKQSAEVAPMKRNASASEVVGKVATFLASDLSTSITGQTLYADCGFNIMNPSGNEMDI